MLTPVTVSLAAWLVVFLGFVVVLVLLERARRRLERDMRAFREAARRLDSVAAAVDLPASPRRVGTVSDLGARRARGDRPAHDLDYAEQTARDESSL
ncbi:hypothetical protein ACWFPY_17605 [Nocardia fluminea]